MRSAIMLPESKPGRVTRGNRTSGMEINSYSSIEKDAYIKLRGTQMQSFEYAKRKKQLWMDL